MGKNTKWTRWRAQQNLGFLFLNSDYPIWLMETWWILNSIWCVKRFPFGSIILLAFLVIYVFWHMKLFIGCKNTLVAICKFHFIINCMMIAGIECCFFFFNTLKVIWGEIFRFQSQNLVFMWYPKYFCMILPYVVLSYLFSGIFL